MRFVVVAALLAYVFWVLVQRMRAGRVVGPRERFFQFRAWSFTGLVILMSLVALVILPDKGRILMLAPLFIGGVTLAKWIQKNRLRLRTEETERSSFERAKRIN